MWWAMYASHASVGSYRGRIRRSSSASAEGDMISLRGATTPPVSWFQLTCAATPGRTLDPYAARQTTMCECTAGDVEMRLYRAAQARVACSTGAASMTQVATAYRRTVSYTHLRAHETRHDLVCRLLLEKKKKNED